MQFGSKYVYNYDNSSEEEISDCEYETGIDTNSAVALVVEKKVESSADQCDSVPDSGTSEEDAVRTKRSDHTVPPLPPRAPTSGIKKIHGWMKSKSKKAKSSDVRDGGDADNMDARQEANRKWRRADTNVVAIQFDQLIAPSNMHTGDPVVCSGCRAMLSHISKLIDDGPDKIWQCEYCDVRNPVDLMLEEIPTKPDVTYMLQPAPTTTASGRTGMDESLVVFCVDISGSMCVSQEVPGVMRLKSSHSDRYSSLNPTGEMQWMPGQNRNVTYITRLQGLQAAVDHQLEELTKHHPDRRVALISFNSEVTIHGDGSSVPITVAGDKLSDNAELIKIGSELNLPSCVKSSRNTLGKMVFDLEEGGQTALGPAMLIAVTLACKVPGSKVIMCTDGLANVGLGNLDCSNDQLEQASAFYGEVAHTAEHGGVSVSVLTIAGSECKLVELGRVAASTSGQVNVVDPLKLTKEFGNILADPVIASQVVATFFVHRGLYIRGELEKASSAVKEVGNVTMTSEITFEYGVRHLSKEERRAKRDSAKIKEDQTDCADSGATCDAGASKDVHAEPTELPFQIQIHYTDLEGAQAMRVLTQTKPVTTERSQAEDYMYIPVLGAHAVKQSSAYAMQGHYEPSRLNAFMYQRLMARNSSNSTERQNQYSMYCNAIAPLENALLDEQRVEARSSDVSVARYETASERPTLGSRISKFFGSKPQKERRQRCPDNVAERMYVGIRTHSSAYNATDSPDEDQERHHNSSDEDHK